MFENPILIYSGYCNYSKKFVDLLKTNETVYNAFIFLNIDVDPQTNKRPRDFYEIQSSLNYKITEVPTIVVEKGQFVLSGEESFKWLEYTFSRFKKKDLTAFNPNEMGSFSDQYSNYGSKNLNDARDQSFRFLNREYDEIETPPIDSTAVSEQDYTKKIQGRNMNMPKLSGNSNDSSSYNINQAINFTKSNYKNSSLSAPKNDVDKKLEELMMQREQIMPKQRPPKNIDFTTGRIMN
jgi:hypothetical protein